jgi:hypothetical protein
MLLLSLIQVGLSETSSSPKDAERGAFSPANAPSWRSAMVAGLCGADGARYKKKGSESDAALRTKSVAPPERTSVR